PKPSRAARVRDCKKDIGPDRGPPARRCQDRRLTAAASGQIVRAIERRDTTMANKGLWYSSTALLIFLALLTCWPVARPDAQGTPGGLVQIDNDDIGGVVTSRNGAEAGVWVIAETTELGTRFAKIAVTDDHGRYVIPDLPPATYDVWVRGYGLVDSPKVKGSRGRLLNLNAVVAPSAAAAAEYYPAIYWFSMLKIPDKRLF